MVIVRFTYEAQMDKWSRERACSSARSVLMVVLSEELESGMEFQNIYAMEIKDGGD